MSTIEKANASIADMEAKFKAELAYVDKALANPAPHTTILDDTEVNYRPAAQQ